MAKEYNENPEEYLKKKERNKSDIGICVKNNSTETNFQEKANADH